MLLGEACNRDAVIVDADAAIDEAARLMRKYHVGYRIVIEGRGDQRFPVGIARDRDSAVEILAEGVASADVNIGDIVSRDLLTVCVRDELFGTLRRMRK